jgi:hypothetical protein
VTPNDQLRVLLNVARTFPQVSLLELPVMQTHASMAMFPIYAKAGGLEARLMAVFYRGSFDSEKPADLMPPEENGFRLVDLAKGRAAVCCWALGIPPDELRKIFVAAASALAKV